MYTALMICLLMDPDMNMSYIFRVGFSLQPFILNPSSSLVVFAVLLGFSLLAVVCKRMIDRVDSPSSY